MLIVYGNYKKGVSMRFRKKRYIHKIAVLVLMLFLHQVMAKGVPNYDWRGAYVGANLGVVWTGSQLNAEQLNLGGLGTSYSHSMNEEDLNPGLQFGYLYTLPQNWVIGGEADFSYPNAHETQLSETGCCTYDRFDVRNNMQGSLRLRFGYAIDRFLPYITTGVSFGNMGLSYSNEAGDTYSKRTTQAGWVLGTGIEYGILNNLSTRLEYIYTDYGNALHLNLPTIDGIEDPNGSAIATMNTNVLRAAINYRF